ncbi:hypothetical protein [Oscillatoria sp. HE19RPO]|uniref:hypothetical protein n=1 Tax=Oscillatoria sp. HE19RPO TaxID=2954806 RepID=UPI0020C4D3BE|nr:hypothetical protein [Oscillatoria sp. HE19RPO]
MGLRSLLLRSRWNRGESDRLEWLERLAILTDRTERKALEEIAQKWIEQVQQSGWGIVRINGELHIFDGLDSLGPEAGLYRRRMNRQNDCRCITLRK